MDASPLQPGPQPSHVAVSAQFQRLRTLLCSIPHVHAPVELSAESLSKEKTLQYGIAIASILEAKRQELEAAINDEVDGQQSSAEDEEILLFSFGVLDPDPPSLPCPSSEQPVM